MPRHLIRRHLLREGLKQNFENLEIGDRLNETRVKMMCAGKGTYVGENQLEKMKTGTRGEPQRYQKEDGGLRRVRELKSSHRTPSAKKSR